MTMATSEKIYVGTGKLMEFNNGGTALKLAFTEEDVGKLRDHLDNGWVRIMVSERRVASATGQTHYGTIDLWKPDPSRARSDVNQPAVDQTQSQLDVMDQTAKDDEGELLF